MNIQCDKFQQFVVAHLGQHQIRSALKHILEELPFRVDERVDFLLHGSAAQELLNENVLRLTDSEGAIGGLIFHRWIPPSIEVNDMRCSSEIQACATGPKGQHEEWNRFVFLELPNERLPLLDFGFAVKH